ARFQIHLPGMQRTDDGLSGDDAVAQWSALVRTLVVDRQEAIAEVENGDLPSLDEGGAALTRRDGIARSHSNPTSCVAHVVTLSMGCNGMNCVGFTGAWPSSHASRAVPFDFFSRSRRPIRTGSGAYTVSLRTLSIPRRSTKS